MKRFEDDLPHGVIPAVLLPFHDDLSIDEQSFRAHLRDVAAVAGLSALTINAHSTEVASCTFDEQRRVLDLTAEEVGDRLPIVHGIYAEDSLGAARIARMAADGGAAALLVFPPGPFTLGHHAGMVVEHYRRIADACEGLPLIAFQYANTSPQSYPMETLLALCDQVPTVRAIKDWISSPPQHARHVEVLQSRTRPVNVLSTHSAWLMPSLVLGCNGLLSGSGSVIADWQARLYAAVREGNLDRAQSLHRKIQFTADVFYASPWVDMHNRMKEALVMLGRMPRATVRPPLVRIGDAERARIRHALVGSGLLTG
jgi:4-hydroxy-tetrahydrodipicolinate synthase